MDTAQDPLLKDAGEFQRLVRWLLYLTTTRPDISFDVQTLSQYMHFPNQSHLDAARRVVRYVKSAPGQGLLLPSSGDGTLKAYCDADWGACLQTRRLVTNYLVLYGNALISWKSKKQETVARSSAEPKFRSMASTATEIFGLIRLFGELDVKLQLHAALFCDSKAAIQIAANPIFHECTKHIDIDCHFIREKIKAGIIKTIHVNTKEQIADVLTKGLGRTQHHHLLCKLGVKNIFLPSNLRGSIEPG
ncbi:PREDICTED: uncharacterized protein LOC109230361 [Nicotiana attenuata]|uniref:uncharacterized protein LOC109230361 n=1 Tax=Nicotiana attenuata TaxID=49451 RepID=UPI000904B726|nr:PREDICTED: uncharacterized protein LOC109230361 [Nicotiana attenuata]